MLLVEVMLAAAALGGMLYLRNSQMVEDLFVQKAENAGQALKHVTDATNAYIAANYEILTDAKAVSDVSSQITAGGIPAWKSTVKRVGDPIGVDYNLCADHQCVGIAINDLKTTGFLNPGMPETNSYGSSYNIIVRRSGTFPEYNLDALVVTSGTIQRLYKSNDPWEPDINAAATVVGADGAVVREATANDAAKGFPAAGVLGAFGEADKQNGKLGWWDAATQWPNITMAGQIAARAGYLSSQWASFLRRSGELAMTGNLNMGGNKIANLKQVTLDAPCDPDPDKAKAMSGQLATISVPVANQPLGNGYLLICGYDQTKNGYIWKKATAGITTTEDVQAGMAEGHESNGQFSCWGLTGGEAAAGAWDLGGIQFIKFIIKNGRAWAYAGNTSAATGAAGAQWINVTRDPAGSDLGYNWTFLNQSFGNFPVPVYDPTLFAATGGYGCKTPAKYSGVTLISGDPAFQVMTGWFFASNKISFIAQGYWSKRALRGAASTGTTAEDLSGIPVTVPVATGVSTSCDPLSGACSSTLTTAPTTITTSARANDYVWSNSPVFATFEWSFPNRTKCNGSNIGPYGSPPPAVCSG